MIAAQQYYIEYCSDLNVDRLYNLLPSYIPDYCLASTDKAVDRWGQLVVQAYKKVIFRSNKEKSVQDFICVCLCIWNNVGIVHYLHWRNFWM